MFIILCELKEQCKKTQALFRKNDDFRCIILIVLNRNVTEEL